MNDQEIIETFEREQITLASFPRRFYAYMIDELLVSALFILIYVQQFGGDGGIEETIAMINGMVGYIMMIKVVYHAFFVSMYGATLGKIFLKIRVVSIQDLENPNFFYATLRAIVRLASESVFYLGFIWAFMNPKRESWHDKAGKTLVVNAF